MDAPAGQDRACQRQFDTLAALFTIEHRKTDIHRIGRRDIGLVDAIDGERTGQSFGQVDLCAEFQLLATRGGKGLARDRPADLRLEGLAVAGIERHGLVRFEDQADTRAEGAAGLAGTCICGKVGIDLLERVVAAAENKAPLIAENDPVLQEEPEFAQRVARIIGVVQRPAPHAVNGTEYIDRPGRIEFPIAEIGRRARKVQAGDQLMTDRAGREAAPQRRLHLGLAIRIEGIERGS